MTALSLFVVSTIVASGLGCRATETTETSNFCIFLKGIELCLACIDEQES